MGSKKLISILAIAIMLLSSIPILSPTGDAESVSLCESNGIATSDSDTSGADYSNANEEEFFTYDEKTGVYKMSTSAYGDYFDLPQTASDDELIPNGAVSEIPMEIAKQMYDENMIGYYEHSGETGEIKQIGAASLSIPEDCKSNYYVGFGAGLNRASEGAIDWDCRLCFGTVEKDGVLPLYLIIQTVSGGAVVQKCYDVVDIVKAYCKKTCVYINQSMLDKADITTSNCVNVLNHAVGDFDGDGDQEIAVAYSNVIVTLKYDTNTGELKRMGTIRDLTNDLMAFEKTNDLLAINMSVGDIDDDFRDELFATCQFFLMEDPVKKKYKDITYLNIYEYSDSKKDLVQIVGNIMELNISGSNYDVCATSVDIGDIDHDGEIEIILGGYIANYVYSTADDPCSCYGKLFLAYAKYNNGSLRFGGTTILSDSDGTAANWELPQQTRKTHAVDKGTKGYNVVSPNWMNWTIPLKAVSLKGNYLDRQRFDQVFFNIGLYEYNPTTDTFDCTSNRLVNLYKNYGIIYSEGCATMYEMKDCLFYDRDGTVSYDGREELILIWYGMMDDLSKIKRDSNIEWNTINEDDSGIHVEKHYVKKVTGQDTKKTLNFKNLELLYVGNYDHDVTFVKKVGQLYMYTDMTVLAMISALPVESDASCMCMNGNDTGYVTISTTTGTSTKEETNIQWSAGGYGSLDLGISLRVAGGGSWGHVTGTEKTMTMSVDYKTSQDTVIAYVIPVDVYVYDVRYYNEEGELVVEMQIIPSFHSPVNRAFSYNGYLQAQNFYQNTTKDMLVRAGEGYSISDVITLDHTAGNVSTYPGENRAKEIRDTEKYHLDIYYEFSGTSGTQTTKSIKGEEKTYTGDSSGGYANLDIGFSVGTKKIKFGGGAHGDFKMVNTTTNTTINGSGFSVTFLESIPPNIKDGAKGITDQLAEYTFRGVGWTNTKEYTVTNYNAQGEVISTKKCQYTYVGFAYDEFRRGLAMGNIEILSDGEYSAYPDSVCFNLNVLSCSAKEFRTDQKPDHYLLQMYIDNKWQNIDENFLERYAFKLYVNTGTDDAPIWEKAGYEFKPGSEDLDIKFLLEGLHGIGVSKINLRSVAVKETVKDIRSMTVVVDMGYVSVVRLFKDDTQTGESYSRWAPEDMYTKEGFVQDGWDSKNSTGEVVKHYAAGDSLAGEHRLYAHWMPVSS